MNSATEAGADAPAVRSQSGRASELPVRGRPAQQVPDETWRRLGLAAMLSGFMVLALLGCAAKPTVQASAPKAVGLPEWMHRAEQATAAGDRDKARDAYRAAAKADPAAKAPWAKLAESYFEAGDYGNAVLAAQEVLHRDSSDSVAAGVLAVSGLRVSTSALALLRQQNNINAGTRGEAETLTRNLRELLGEPVLVPRPVVSEIPPAQGMVRTKVRAKSAAPAPAVAAPALAAKPTASASGSSNPFDKLR